MTELRHKIIAHLLTIFYVMFDIRTQHRIFTYRIAQRAIALREYSSKSDYGENGGASQSPRAIMVKIENSGY
ncbi:MAG: hypothetical protein EAZ78_28470 [Oscillatoriales cyanobacterium]|uniref:hypothetical protein n=1 Tax=Microcoleus anatoxicus TaxID=2705319 RepID=UPI002976C254|nr:MAG: hypothetical protein EAZ78_28470 [Oscillatoriales cyanobacterium]TAF60210.1 MAG: hypothetical protein EAZ59_26760 [Oscillatoriales cyanobacterium]